MATKEKPNNEHNFFTGGYKVVYAFSRPDGENVKGMLKIGDALLKTDKSIENITRDDLEKAARKRIKQYMDTGLVSFDLEGVWLAVKKDENGNLVPFRDYLVRQTLRNSGYESYYETGKGGIEWMKNITVDAVEKAVIACRNGETYFIDEGNSKILELYPHQKAAVEQSAKVMVGGSIESPLYYLWDAKMRFGKTIAAYELVKRLKDVKKVLIITHRPVVNDGWFGDFKKFRMDEAGWVYGTKRNGDAFAEFVEKNKDKSIVWFASIQDLRDHDALKQSANYKNKEILFNTDWDLVITDEAHEGTLTEISARMYKRIKSKYFLDLSGTPFNISNAVSLDGDYPAERFNYAGKFFWTYLDEQKAKREWDENFPDLINPYANMPNIHFMGYDLADVLDSDVNDLIDENYLDIVDGDVDSVVVTDSLTELFRVKEVVVDGRVDYRFVNEVQVKDFLSKLRGDRRYSKISPELFPFHDDNKDQFLHSLWLLPSARAVSAMTELLGRASSGFSGWNIVNATGLGDERAVSENEARDAFERVKEAVKGKRSITLSYKMLTTGVSVPEWSAVLNMSGGAESSPMGYIQAAFRATTPGVLPNGAQKTDAFVFDFNPNRMLSSLYNLAIAPAVNNTVSSADVSDGDNSDNVLTSVEIGGTGDGSVSKREAIEEFLEYVNVLAIKDAHFKSVDTDGLLKKINKAFVDDVVYSGFSSARLWDGIALNNFDISKVKLMRKLRELQGKNVESGLPVVPVSDEQLQKSRELAKRLSDKKRELGKLSEKDAEALSKAEAEVKEAEKIVRNNRENALKILSGVAVRIPMLIFASELETKITAENFASLIDDASWKEFMPANLERVMPKGVLPIEERLDSLERVDSVLYWDDIAQFFDEDVFTLSCERIRELVVIADSKDPLERAVRIAALFELFKNPDKETVLTPFRVANLQIVSSFGGYSFVDLERSSSSETFVWLKRLSTGVVSSFLLRDVDRLLDSGDFVVSPQFVAPRVSDSDSVSSVSVSPSVSNSDGVGSSIVGSSTGVVDSRIIMGSNGTVRRSDGLTGFSGNGVGFDYLEGSTGVLSDFWVSAPTSLDINSKTALYPLVITANIFISEMLKLGLSFETTDQDKKRAIWNSIVAENIFINVRVPYSRSIAQRVLLGYLGGSTKVNCTVFDVMSFINVLKAWNAKSDFKVAFDGVGERDGTGRKWFSYVPDWWVKIDDVYGFTSVVLRLLNRGFVRECFSPGLRFSLGDLVGSLDVFDMIVDRVLSVEDIVSGVVSDRMVALKELIDIIGSLDIEDIPRFDVVVSNPPYQMDTGGKRHQVYADFYMVGSNISVLLSMVFPKGWQTSTGRASGSSLHSTIREDKAIVSVDNYDEEPGSPMILFEGAGTGGVNLVLRDRDVDSSMVKFLEFGQLVDAERDMTVVKYWNETTDIIFNKISEWINEHGLTDMSTSVSPWGTHLPSSKIFGEPLYQEYISKIKEDGYIACYGSMPDDIGRSKYGWFYIDKNAPDLKLQENTPFDYRKFKVIFGVAGGANAIYRKAIILEPNTISSAAFIGVYFNNEKQAANFLSYLKTYFYRALLFETSSNKINVYANVHRFVPDLSTVTNPRTNKIGWDSDWTDDDLKILFKDVLTERDWAYIEKTAIESDPAGLKLFPEQQVVLDNAVRKLKELDS